MEAEKRKRSENDVVVDGLLPKKVKEEGGEEEEDTTVVASDSASPPEEEVEEFFAILRRMHDAMNYLSKSTGDSRRFTNRWPTVMETEVVGVVAGAKKDESVGKEELFDLNVAPEPEISSG